MEVRPTASEANDDSVLTPLWMKQPPRLTVARKRKDGELTRTSAFMAVILIHGMHLYVASVGLIT